MNSVLRPMSTSEILDRTFSLYRNNFLVFAGIATLPALLALILHVVGVTAHLTVRTPNRTLAEFQLISYSYQLLVFFIASIVGGAIATGASVYAVYYLHLGKPATIAGSYKNVLSAWFRVIAAAILVFLVVVSISAVAVIALATAIFWPTSLGGELSPLVAGLAVIAMLVAVLLCWLYLSAWLSFVIPAVLLDKNRVFRSFRRSHRLSKGSRWRIFLVLLLTLILTLAFAWTLRIPAYVIFDQRRQQAPLQLWSYAADFLSAILAGPIATIAIALFYIDQRIRKEAFDLHLMMQSIQESTAAQAAMQPAPAEIARPISN